MSRVARGSARNGHTDSDKRSPTSHFPVEPSFRHAQVRGQRGDRRGGVLCPTLLYVRRSEPKEISPYAVDVSSFAEAKQVAPNAEEERQYIEAKLSKLDHDV